MWLIFLALLALLGSPTAKAVNVNSNVDASCRQLTDDPFDLGWKMPFLTLGPNHGRCINTLELRTLRPLSPDEFAAYDRRRPLLDDEIALANFRWRDRYWIVRLRPSAIYDAAPVLEPFEGHGPISHVMILFNLRDESPLTLYPQNGVGPRAQMWDFLFSAEPVHPPGTDDSRGRSFFNDMAMSYNLQAVEDKYRVSILEKGRELVVLPVKLDDGDPKRMFDEVVRRGTRNGHRLLYNPVFRSCVTVPLGIVDRIVGSWNPLHLLRKMITMPITRFPRILNFSLRVRGYRSPEAAYYLRGEIESGRIRAPLVTR